MRSKTQDRAVTEVRLRSEFREDAHYSLDAPIEMPAGSVKLSIFKEVEQTMMLREGRYATAAEQQENIRASLNG